MADKSFQEILFRNKGSKVASLLLACVTWYAIQAVISNERLIADVPLVLRVEPGWAVLETSAKSVDIVFRGSQEDVGYLNRDQIKVEVDIRDKAVKDGTLTLRLKPENVKSPGAVRAVAIRPQEITLRLDQEGEKTVPVKADLQGTPPEGYEVEKVVVDPATVNLQGPKQRFDEIASVRTAAIDLEGRSRDFKKLKVPVLPPADNWVGGITPSNVEVHVSMVERSATREVPRLPVKVLVQPGPRPRLDVWPNQVTVTVKGRADLLKDLPESDIQAYVDCSALKPGGTYDLPVRVQAPAGLVAVNVDPATVKVTLGEL